MKKIWLMVLLFLMMAGGRAMAREGYLIQFEKDAAMVMKDDLRPLFSEAGLYYTEDESRAQELHKSGLAEVTAQGEPMELSGVFEYSLSYNDPYYNAGRLWNLDLIQADRAFSKNARGQGVTVGIIDTGLNPGHDDIDYSRVGQGYNIISEAADPLDTADRNGHGTFVAGMVAADANNGKGIAGIADMVTLIPLKFMDPAAPEGERGGYISDLIAAIQKADALGCDVINISAGLREDKIQAGELSALKTAVDTVTQKGMIVVASVGNEGTEDAGEAEAEGFVGTDICQYPAALENVIGVGCVGKEGKISVVSNKNASVDVVAGGESVYGLWKNAGASYLKNTGTSFSAPAVAAGAAVMKAIDPGLDAEGVRKLIMETSKDLGLPGRDDAYGYGLLQLDDMISRILEQREEPFYMAPAVYENGKVIHYFKAIKTIENANAYYAVYDGGTLADLAVFPLEAGMEKTVVADRQDSLKQFFWSGMRPME